MRSIIRSSLLLLFILPGCKSNQGVNGNYICQAVPINGYTEISGTKLNYIVEGSGMQWLWQDMTLNTDILYSLYESVFKDYFIFRNERSVPVPTFVAMGKYDYVDPYTLWKGFDDIRGLTVKVFDKSGHTPQLEESDLFDRELLGWLRESSGSLDLLKN
jgi:pimeloyl-ACP methyl ester carboxylesterase